MTKVWGLDIVEESNNKTGFFMNIAISQASANVVNSPVLPEVPLPPVQYRPSCASGIRQNYPSWVLVSEVTPRWWVVVESVLFYGEPGTKPVTNYLIYVYDSFMSRRREDEQAFSWWTDAVTYGQAEQRYHDMIKNVIEFIK